MLKFKVVYPVSIDAAGLQTFGTEKVKSIEFDDAGELSCVDIQGKSRFVRNTGAELLMSASAFDKDGNEIYQGDILEDDQGKKYDVVRSNGAFGAVLIDESYDTYEPLSDLFTRKCKITGNFYSSPKLPEEAVLKIQ